MPKHKPMFFPSTIFLLLVGSFVAWLSSSKWEAAVFVFVVACGIVIFGVIPPKESEDEPDILYFNLSAEENQTKEMTYKKYFIGMVIALSVMSIPIILKYGYGVHDVIFTISFIR